MKDFEINYYGTWGTTHFFGDAFYDERECVTEIRFHIRAMYYKYISKCTEIGSAIAKYLNQVDPRSHWMYREDLSCPEDWVIVVQDPVAGSYLDIKWRW